jgi:hypothetical protein
MEEEGRARLSSPAGMDSFSVIQLLMLAWLGFLLAARREVQRMRQQCRAAPRGMLAEPELLEERSHPIGRFAGREIYASVTFMGRRYCFAGVAPRDCRARLQSGELLVEPGLLYRPDS